MVALRDDGVFVPIALLDGRLEFFRFSERAGDLFLAILAPYDFFAARGHDVASTRDAPLVVQDSRVGRSGLHVRLITTDHPVLFIENFAAILNAGIGEALVIVRRDLEPAAQFKISDGAVGPNQKRVSLRGMLLGRLAGDHTLFYRPKLRVAVPTGEVFAVEDRVKTLFRVGGGDNCGVRQQSRASEN